GRTCGNRQRHPPGEVVQMCTTDGSMPGSVAEALRMAHASMDYLNSPAAADLPAAACGQALAALGEVRAKHAAAYARLLRRFDAAGGHDADGYGTAARCCCATGAAAGRAAAGPRRAPPAAQEGRRQDLRPGLRAAVPVPPRRLHPPPGLAADPAPRRHHRSPKPRREPDPQEPRAPHPPSRITRPRALQASRPSMAARPTRVPSSRPVLLLRAGLAWHRASLIRDTALALTASRTTTMYPLRR